MASYPFTIEEIVNKISEKHNLEVASHKVLEVQKRPFSIVFKIALRCRAVEDFNIYLKYMHKQYEQKSPHKVKRDYDTTLFWWQRFEENDSFKVIEPLYYSGEEYVVATRESKGSPISVYLNKIGQIFPSSQAHVKILEMLNLVGGWLKYFQQIPIEENPEAVSLSYILEYINERMDRMVSKTKIGFDVTMQERVNNFIRTQWELCTQQDKALSYLHSDLSLSNVLYNEGTVTVLDFSKNTTGSVYKDLSRFYHQLNLLSLKPTFQTKFVNYLKDEFLIGYGDEQIYENPMFKIYYMTHLINHMGKSARFWEQSLRSRTYNRWVVYKTMKKLKEMV